MNYSHIVQRHYTGSPISASIFSGVGTFVAMIINEVSGSTGVAMTASLWDGILGPTSVPTGSVFAVPNLNNSSKMVPIRVDYGLEMTKGLVFSTTPLTGSFDLTFVYN